MATQQEILAKFGQTPEASNRGGNSGNLTYMEGALGTALWDMAPGLLGVEPTGNLQKWQQENPIGSVVSGMAGMAVPYTAAFKASQNIKPWANFVEKAAPASSLAKNPFLAGTSREIARWAPVEAGLVGAGALAGEPVADMLDGDYRGWESHAGTNALALGVGGLAGGALTKLGTMGQAALRKRGVTPGADLSAMPQVQIRQVRESLQRGEVAPDAMAMAEAGINRLRRRVINEDPPGRFYTLKEQEKSEEMEWLVKPGKPDGRSWSSRKITSFQGEEAESVLRGMEGMPEDWEAFARYPRVLNPRKAKNSELEQMNVQKLDESVMQRFPGESQQGRYRWKALPEDGMFAVAKQMDGGRWLTFQTDNPTKFFPEDSRWANVIKQENLKNFADIDPNVDLDNVQSQILQWGRQQIKESPVTDSRGMRDEKRGLGAGLNKGFKTLGMEAQAQNTAEGLKRFGMFSRSYLAPADLQFTNNPVAHRIRRTAKEMLDRGELLTQRAILGDPTNAGRNLMRETSMGPNFDDPSSIAAKIKKVSDSDPDEWNRVLKTIHAGEGVDGGIKNYGLGEDGADILRRIQEVDDELSSSIIEAQRASGVPEADLFRPKEGHFMLSRTWKGNWRTPVYNESGSLVYIAGGTSRKESQSIAQEVSEQLGFRMGDSLTTDMWGDLDMMRQVQIQSQDWRTSIQQAAKMVSGRKPGTFNQRQGVEGFVMDYTPEEFLRSLVNHSRRYRNYEAELATQTLFKGDMERLALEDKQMAEQLKKRLDMMFGKEGEISKAVNKAADTILAPVMGNNSASRVMGTLNAGMYRYALGFMNTGYGIATLLTFAQTAFPMMSMINTLAMQAPQRLGKYTSYKPILSENGAEVMGMLDPMKIAGQAFREIGNADDILATNLRRAAAEGTTDPRFLDEFVGQNSVSKQKFSEILSKDQPVVGFLKALADTVPATTERFARGHSFAMGHVFYRDVMGVKDSEQLFKLAKEFTDKTQYLYGTGDRAQLITGPIGSSFGLFKNWVMNYIGWMAAYAGEAFMYNNFKPLMLMMAGTGAVGGVGALPLVGAYNGVSKALGGDSAMYQIYEGFGGGERDDGPGVADMIYYGLPMALGISVQSTVQAPFHNPTEDAARFFQMATWDQGKKIGRAISTSTRSFMDNGYVDVGDPMVRQHLASGFAPKSVYKAVSAMSSNTIRSQNNANPLIQDMSPSERLLYGASLNPRWVSTRFALSREMWEDEKKRKARTSELGRQMAEAQNQRDRRQMQRIIYAANADNISLDTIMRSATSHRSRDEEDIITSTFDEMALERLTRLGLL